MQKHWKKNDRLLQQSDIDGSLSMIIGFELRRRRETVAQQLPTLVPRILHVLNLLRRMTQKNNSTKVAEIYTSD